METMGPMGARTVVVTANNDPNRPRSDDDHFGSPVVCALSVAGLHRGIEARPVAIVTRYFGSRQCFSSSRWVRYSGIARATSAQNAGEWLNCPR